MIISYSLVCLLSMSSSGYFSLVTEPLIVLFVHLFLVNVTDSFSTLHYFECNLFAKNKSKHEVKER